MTQQSPSGPDPAASADVQAPELDFLDHVVETMTAVGSSDPDFYVATRDPRTSTVTVFRAGERNAAMEDLYSNAAPATVRPAFQRATMSAAASRRIRHAFLRAMPVLLSRGVLVLQVGGIRLAGPIIVHFDDRKHAVAAEDLTSLAPTVPWPEEVYDPALVEFRPGRPIQFLPGIAPNHPPWPKQSGPPPAAGSGGGG